MFYKANSTPLCLNRDLTWDKSHYEICKACVCVCVSCEHTLSENDRVDLYITDQTSTSRRHEDTDSSSDPEKL